MALHDKLPLPPIVSLRRYGDIVNLLPLLRFLSLKTKAPVKLIVHRTFAPVLDGVSYVEPIIWDGDMDDPLIAVKAHGGVNAQVHGKGLKADRSNGNNFAKTAWRQLGYEWDRHTPLIFDRRDSDREQQLTKGVSMALPKVLVKLGGFSSVFAEQEKLWALLHSEFDGLCEFVDLDKVNCERIYDMLGWLDKAACLISIDTVALWLARGSRCPVIALTNDLPFLASPPVGNVLVRLPYRDVFKCWGRIAAAVHSTLFETDNDRIVLVFNHWTPTDADFKRRESIAYATWPLLQARLLPFAGQRSSKSIGDVRATAFIRDMIAQALHGDEGIIAIVNNDIKFDVKLRDAVLKSCAEFGCYWTYRGVSPENKATDQGGDFFAFTRKWWFEHEKLFPDMLIGYHWWDDLMVRMMRWSGCMEQERLYYHEPHQGALQRPPTPGTKHNEKLALAWLVENYELKQKPAL